mmetsp:Transcript_867/g.3178  ORF Transcript_867/g.3178 Transcript_867/m.3178 type:complete len:1720 (+) Transcript_867:84-5243(+)
MGRRKGAAVAGTKFKAASSSGAQDLLQRQGMQTGFIGFSSSRMAGSGISELPGEVRMAFKKVSKKDVTTKLKAFADLLDLLQAMDEQAMLPCLQPWVPVLNGLTLEHDRRVRMVGLQVHDVVVKTLGKRIAPELKNLFGAWAVLMHDRHKECRELAVATFEGVFPEAKRGPTWLYCKDQLYRTVGDTLKHQPETLCDMRKVTPAQAQDVWVQAVSACLGAACTLLGYLQESDMVAKEESKLLEVFSQDFWKLFSHKVSHIRRASYTTLTTLVDKAPFVVEQRLAKTTGNVLTALREEDQYACAEMVPLVASFFRAFPAGADDLKKGQLRQARTYLARFLENAAFGASSCLAGLSAMLTALPATVKGPSGEFYKHVLENLWAGRQSKFCHSAGLKQAVLEAYCSACTLAVSAAAADKTDAETATETKAETERDCKEWAELATAGARPFLALFRAPGGQLAAACEPLATLTVNGGAKSEDFASALLERAATTAVDALVENSGQVQSCREVAEFLAEFQRRTQRTDISRAVISAALSQPESEKELVPATGLLVALSSLVTAHGDNAELLPCAPEGMAELHYLPWLRAVDCRDAAAVEWLCRSALAPLTARDPADDQQLHSRMAEPGAALLWSSLVATAAAREAPVATTAALLKSAAAVAHSAAALRCPALDAIALDVARGPALAKLSGRALLANVVGGHRSEGELLLSDEVAGEVVEALLARLQSFAEEEADEASYSLTAMQIAVNGLLVVNDALKSAPLAARHPGLLCRCMAAIFRLRACTKYYWKQLRLDPRAVVVVDDSLPTEVSSLKERERSPVSLLANGVWEKRATEFMAWRRESGEGEALVALLAETVQWSIRTRTSAWFNAELDARQAADLWELAGRSQEVLDLLLQPAEAWRKSRAVQPVWELVDRNKEPFTAVLPRECIPKVTERESAEAFLYPRLIRFVLQLSEALPGNGLLLAIFRDTEETPESTVKDKTKAMALPVRHWLVRELCTAYVLVRDAAIPPVGKGSDWHDEWGIAAEVLLEKAEMSLFAALRRFQKETQRERTLGLTLAEFFSAVTEGQEGDSALLSGQLLSSYALALFVHTVVSGDGERAAWLWEHSLRERTSVLLENGCPSSPLQCPSLWLLEATLPEVVSSLPPLRLREIGVVALQERAIEILCSDLVAGKCAAVPQALLCHLLHTPLANALPAGDEVGAQLSCALLSLSESTVAKGELSCDQLASSLSLVRLLQSMVERYDAREALTAAGQLPLILSLCASVLNLCLWECAGHLLVVRSSLLLFRRFLSTVAADQWPDAEISRCLSPLFRLFLSSGSAAVEEPTVGQLLSLLSRTVAKRLPERQSVLETEVTAETEAPLYRLLGSRHAEVQKSACILLSASFSAYGPLSADIVPEGAEAMEMEESLLPPALEALILSATEEMERECNAAADDELEECPYVFQAPLQRKVRALLVWSLAMDFTFAQCPAVSRVIARWLGRTAAIDRFLAYFFRLVRSNTSSIMPAENLCIAALDPLCAQSQLRFLAELYLRVLETVPALVRSWWSLSRDRRLTAEVEEFTSQYISPVLVRKELLACARHEVEPYSNFEIRSNLRSRSVVAVFTEDDVSTEVVLSLPESYPLRPVEVQCEQAKDVFRWRVWLAQDATLLKAVTMWMRYMEDLFDGIESCLICYSVYHDSKKTLPNLTCKTCKNKFHSPCLYKWFNTSHKSNCPLCQTPWMD